MQVEWSCCLRSRRGTLIPCRGSFLSPNSTFCTPDSGPGRWWWGGCDKGDRGKKRGRGSVCLCVYVCSCVYAGSRSYEHTFFSSYPHNPAHTCAHTHTHSHTHAHTRLGPSLQLARQVVISSVQQSCLSRGGQAPCGPHHKAWVTSDTIRVALTLIQSD